MALFSQRRVRTNDDSDDRGFLSVFIIAHVFTKRHWQLKLLGVKNIGFCIIFFNYDTSNNLLQLGPFSLIMDDYVKMTCSFLVANTNSSSLAIYF